MLRIPSIPTPNRLPQRNSADSADQPNYNEYPHCSRLLSEVSWKSGHNLPPKLGKITENIPLSGRARKKR
jgi:hypothetical protein